jgi:hypothetical protein
VRHHSGVGLMTPAMVHGGEVEGVTQVRKLTLSAAFEGRPERFVRERHGQRSCRKRPGSTNRRPIRVYVKLAPPQKRP